MGRQKENADKQTRREQERCARLVVSVVRVICFISSWTTPVVVRTIRQHRERTDGRTSKRRTGEETRPPFHFRNIKKQASNGRLIISSHHLRQPLMTSNTYGYNRRGWKPRRGKQLIAPRSSTRQTGRKGETTGKRAAGRYGMAADEGNGDKPSKHAERSTCLIADITREPWSR